MLPLILLFALRVDEVRLDPAAAKPPTLKTVPHELKLHGETLVDNYFWLREKTNPEVIDYLDRENAYTEAVMKPTEALQKELYDEMLGRIKQTDLSVPYGKRGYLYWTRFEEGKQYPIYMRRKAGTSTDEVLLDVNEMAKGQKFMSVGDFEVNDRGDLLAYTTDNTGFRQYRLHVKNLTTNQDFPDTVERVTSVEWAADNSTLFFATEDEVSKRSDRVFRMSLGGKPIQIYEEKDALYRVSPSRSKDGKYIFLNSGSFDNNEVRYIPADNPTAAGKVIQKRTGEVKYSAEHRDGKFYIHTNKNSKDFEIMVAPVSSSAMSNWKPFYGPLTGGSISGFSVFKNHMVISKRQNGLPALEIFDFKSAKGRDVPVSESLYSIGGHTNEEFDTAKFRYSYSSPVTSQTIFELDLNSLKSTVLKQTEVLGGFNPKLYTTERIYATAPDGEQIPIGLVYKKGPKQDGKNPCLLGGYGAYGSPAGFGFNGNIFSLLDRGFVYAYAQIRGGGDFGKKWHDAGKMMRKRTTFTDFAACADELVFSGWTSRDKLAISGASAGGLLIGATLNLRPDLCKAAIVGVPFVDVINTMYDETLPLTVGEFLEWGNPKVEAEYRYIRTYSPYENIRDTKYPALLVKTSLNDSQVMYWEPAKYTARMRAVGKPALLLLRCNMAGGHGGSSGRYDQLKERAMEYAFLIGELGG
jgi:oligopeptidase B